LPTTSTLPDESFFPQPAKQIAATTNRTANKERFIACFPSLWKVELPEFAIGIGATVNGIADCYHLEIS
jgi:hypothetical protein